jgi:hypothetical protein
MAQWSPDSTLNLTICDLSGEQVLPKICATSDGGCFISWFDTRSGSYCVYLQRLDYQGNPQLGDDGLLVSDQPQMSWLVNYSMAVDGSDNAIIAFSDERNAAGELDVSVYKISSTGEFLWGVDGICLSDPSVPGFEPNPSVAVTGLGNCVFAWGKSEDTDYLIFQKLSPDGDKLWGDWGVTLESSADLSVPVLVPSGQDSVIAMWKSSTGSYPMTVTHLYADMLGTDGSGLWGDSPVLIYDTGSISPWAYPGMISDGLGGAYCYWYDAPSPSEFNVWAQHLDVQGEMQYPMNGAQGSTFGDNRLHMSPSGEFDPVSGQGYLFWAETDGSQNYYGVYGQAFSAAGERLWTDSGLELLPLGSQQTGFVEALAAADGIFVSFFIDATATSLRVWKLGYDGAVLWGPVTLSAGSLGGKDDPVVCAGWDDGAYYAWTDFRSDGGVYAQNIQSDGTLGQYLGIESEGAGFAVRISPNPSRGAVSISLSGPVGRTVVVGIYDLAGRLVDSLGTVLGEEGATLLWNRRDSVPPGIYLVRTSCGESVTSRRMVLL